jgi:predicted transcriptional regulator
MTTTINIELQTDLLGFVERYAKQINRRRDEIITEAIKLLRNEWELEQGYREDNEETRNFAETAIPLFAEVRDETLQTR